MRTSGSQHKAKTCDFIFSSRFQNHGLIFLDDNILIWCLHSQLVHDTLARVHVNSKVSRVLQLKVLCSRKEMSYQPKILEHKIQYLESWFGHVFGYQRPDWTVHHQRRQIALSLSSSFGKREEGWPAWRAWRWWAGRCSWCSGRWTAAPADTSQP